MRLLHKKHILEFVFFYSFIIVTTFAQTPFQGLFGFFGSGNSNNSTPSIQITTPTPATIFSSTNQGSVTVSGACSIAGRTVTIESSATALGTTTCSSSKTFSTTVDLTSILDGTRPITAKISNILGAIGSSTVLIDKDTVGPTINFASNLGFVGGSNSNVSFTVTERHATTSNYVLEVSQNSGSPWTALGVVSGTAGNLFNQTFNYNWNPVNNWDLSTVRIKITSTDSLGQSTVKISPTFVVDSGKPTIGVGSFSINSGAGSTSSMSVRLALSASDTFSNVTQFCFKHTDMVEPTLADPCWNSVSANPPNLTPATTLTLVNFPFTLPAVFGTYDIYAWVRDAGGNISTLSNTGAGTNGLDKASIIYVPPVPATVIDIIASRTDTPATPPSATDLTIPAGSSVYIRWNVTDDKVLPASPISLYYTTNDVDYTLIANNVDNAANAGCTISGSQTGCYVWTNGSPVSAYYKIRVAATDSDASTTTSSSPPLNVATTFNMLAGNTDTGTDGSANAAMFINVYGGIIYPDLRSFVVTSTGVLYFLDTKRGLLKVDPSTGRQELLIKNGASAGDGLAITDPGVTLDGANQIILDFQENLYIYEKTKIRKIDMSVNPPVISTIIGGGVSRGTDIAATSLQIAPELSKSGDNTAAFFATPDGKLYFRSEYNSLPISNQGKLRYYDPATSKVYTKFSINGVRTVSGTDRDVTLCDLGSSTYAFDTINSELTYGMALIIDRGTDTNCTGTYAAHTSEVDATNGTISAATPPGSGVNSSLYFHTGMDGKIYTVYRAGGSVYRYDSVTKNWDHILGMGKGSCIDGTLATSCPMELIDLFVTKNSSVYFIDRGRIRMIDPISKKVYTLYGQTFSAGDGGNPLSARFNTITNLKSWVDSGTTKYVALDYAELRFREFSIGSTISTIAGNGTTVGVNTTAAANTQGLGISTGSNWHTFAIEPTDGRLYYPRLNRLDYIDRTTGKWVDLTVGGPTAYSDPAADGLTGNQIHFPGYMPWPLAVNSSKQVLTAASTWIVAGTTNSMLKLYDHADGKQTHFSGVPGVVPSSSIMCAAGVDVASCSMPVTVVIDAIYDSFRDKFLLYSISSTLSNAVIKIGGAGAGDKIVDYRTLPRQVVSLAYRRDAGLTYEWFYYCDVNGRLYKYNNLTSTETQLNLPTTTMTCGGRGISYSESRNSLIFGLSQNGLGAIAEYPNP